MMFANRMQQYVLPRPVGTRGGCGDGWGPCACPDGNTIRQGFREAAWSHSDEDKHKAPSSTPPRPLSLQKTTPSGRQNSSFLLNTGHIPLILRDNFFVETVGASITPFGCQSSLGTRGGHGVEQGPCACPGGSTIRPGSVRPSGRSPN